MKRTNLIATKYLHCCLGKLPGRVLYGLIMPPGIKPNKNRKYDVLQ